MTAPNSEPQPEGPLSGIRVVDLTQALAGPYATLLLADGGADVIKIERPGAGDPSRGWGPPFLQPSGSGDAESGYFLSVNRGKRSVALDLKDPTDRERLEELISEADVVAENFRPGTLARLGFDPERLQRAYPRLIGLSITAFGEGGPDGHRPGFDQIAQGEGGLMSITGPDADHLVKVGVPIGDILAGTYGAVGVLMALQEREKSGVGQWVRTSLLEGMLAIHTMQGARWLLGGEVPTAIGNKHPTICPYNTYSCSDGVLNLAIGSEALWRAFAPEVGIDPDEPGYRTNAERVANSNRLDALINDRLAENTVDHWMERFDGAGVPAGRVKSLDQVYTSEQVAHLGALRRYLHPTVGDIALVAPPIRFSRSPSGATTPPPTLGEHDEDMDWHR